MALSHFINTGREMWLVTGGTYKFHIHKGSILSTYDTIFDGIGIGQVCYTSTNSVVVLLR